MALKSLLESVYGETAPDEYRRMFESQYSDRPGTTILKKGMEIHNPKESDHTGDRKAYLDYPWIKCWQAFTKNNNNKLQCACCGKNVYVDENTAECQKEVEEYNRGKDKKEEQISAEKLKAVGAHLYINGKDASSGYYIVPMCKDHNGKPSYETMTIADYVTAVEECQASLKK